jgi:hypothetical protein
VQTFVKIDACPKHGQVIGIRVVEMGVCMKIGTPERLP